MATRLQQPQPVSQPLRPLAQARMMNTPARLFSLDINSTGMAILCQREKARYRKDTKPHQTKNHPLDGFFLLQIVDIPG
jgi:hypothetical protein